MESCLKILYKPKSVWVDVTIYKISTFFVFEAPPTGGSAMCFIRYVQSTPTNIKVLCWLDDKIIILRYISATVNQWLNHSYFLQYIIQIIDLIWLDLKIIPTTFYAIFKKISELIEKN